MAGHAGAKARRNNRSSAGAASRVNKNALPTKPNHGRGGSKPPQKQKGGSKPSGRPQEQQAGGALAEGLVIVATPIGNAADITLRALDALRQADVIACEDTRVTSKLLAIHGIASPLVPYHEHNAGRVGPRLIERLKNGKTVALVSDAGTPLVSDPGYKLVRACLEEKIPVTPLPGASSILAALVVSGLPTDRFFFAGFLPPKSAARLSALAEIAEIPATLVFLETAKRLTAALQDMAAVLGAREAAVARELTKKFEETRRGTLDDLAAHYREAGAPRGEVTIVAAPFAGLDIDDTELDRLLLAALDGASVKDAAQIVTAATGLQKKRVYARALVLKEGRE